MLRLLIDSQKKLSRIFDKFLPKKYRVFGDKDLKENIIQLYIKPYMHVCDVGAGRNPCIDKEFKNRMLLKITGLDISKEQLQLAPQGSYDKIITRDICKKFNKPFADLVICQALLEHIPDVNKALEGIYSIIKPGGTALIFVPSSNAIYAQLNLLLPERLKRKILFFIFPESRNFQGFISYYHDCTPQKLLAKAKQTGFEIIDARYYYYSVYFTFFLPLHALWRLWIVIYKKLYENEAAETFTLCLKKSLKPSYTDKKPF